MTKFGFSYPWITFKNFIVTGTLARPRTTVLARSPVSYNRSAPLSQQPKSAAKPDPRSATVTRSPPNTGSSCIQPCQPVQIQLFQSPAANTNPDQHQLQQVSPHVASSVSMTVPPPQADDQLVHASQPSFMGATASSLARSHQAEQARMRLENANLLSSAHPSRSSILSASHQPSQRLENANPIRRTRFSPLPTSHQPPQPVPSAQNTSPQPATPSSSSPSVHDSNSVPEPRGAGPPVARK